MFTGPLPVYHDDPWMLDEMHKAWIMCCKFVQTRERFRFCNAGNSLIDKHGVIYALLYDTGLPLDRRCEFKSV